MVHGCVCVYRARPYGKQPLLRFELEAHHTIHAAVAANYSTLCFHLAVKSEQSARMSHVTSTLISFPLVLPTIRHAGHAVLRMHTRDPMRLLGGETYRGSHLSRDNGPTRVAEAQASASFCPVLRQSTHRSATVSGVCCTTPAKTDCTVRGRNLGRVAFMQPAAQQNTLRVHACVCVRD